MIDYLQLKPRQWDGPQIKSSAQNYDTKSIQYWEYEYAVHVIFDIIDIIIRTSLGLIFRWSHLLGGSGGSWMRCSKWSGLTTECPRHKRYATKHSRTMRKAKRNPLGYATTWRGAMACKKRKEMEDSKNGEGSKYLRIQASYLFGSLAIAYFLQSCKSCNKNNQ